MNDTDAARAVAERYAAAWLGDDLDGILGCYADDLTLHYFGNNPFSGDHVGKNAAIEVLLATGAAAPRKLVAVDEVLAGPGTAVLVVREAVTVAGQTSEVTRVLRYRVENGCFAECWLYEHDQAFIDAAWSS